MLPALREVDAGCAAGLGTGFVSYDASPAFDAAFTVPGVQREDDLPLVWFGLHEAAGRGSVAATGAEVPGPWSAEVEREAYDAAGGARCRRRSGGARPTRRTSRCR